MTPQSCKFAFLSVNTLLLAAFLTCIGNRAEAQTIVLGTAESFAVLGGASVVNTGATVVSGDLGVSPGASITGFPPGIVTGGGTIHLNDTVAVQAHTDALAAYGQLAGLSPTDARDMTSFNLGGLTLTPGVYHFSSTAAFTSGTLTLDGLNQSNPLFVFQIGSTLVTTGVTSFNLINGATASNIWFQVGSSASLGMGTSFVGTIIASASDTLVTGVSVDGRVIALSGTVTLDTNQITMIAAIPEPATTVFLVSSLALLLVLGKRRRVGSRA